MIKSASSLIIHKNKVLLLHRDNKPSIPFPDKWQSIGGHMEAGETYDQCIRREIKEETNLEPSTIQCLGIIRSGDTETAIHVIYLTDEEASHAHLGNEGQEIRFVSLEEMKELPLALTVKMYFDKYYKVLEKLVRGEKINPEELPIERKTL
jgi:8-oxo-dGTP diphosphatase